jgi:hypothetical protein
VLRGDGHVLQDSNAQLSVVALIDTYIPCGAEDADGPWATLLQFFVPAKANKLPSHECAERPTPSSKGGLGGDNNEARAQADPAERERRLCCCSILNAASETVE